MKHSVSRNRNSHAISMWYFDILAVWFINDSNNKTNKHSNREERQKPAHINFYISKQLKKHILMLPVPTYNKKEDKNRNKAPMKKKSNEKKPNLFRFFLLFIQK